MKKIVLIEDDKLIVRIIEFILQKEGYSIFTANDGNEGLKIIEEIKPDLILTDIMLTYKSGLEVISISKKKNPHIPIVIISALRKEEINKVKSEIADVKDDLQVIKQLMTQLLSKGSNV